MLNLFQLMPPKMVKTCFVVSCFSRKLIPKVMSKHHTVELHISLTVDMPEPFAQSRMPLDCGKSCMTLTRFTAIWFQVSKSITVLSISLYCHAGADDSLKELNNDLLDKTFKFASQFGNIPVLVCGDLQSLPSAMPAFQAAEACNAWFDPLNNPLDDSNHRPITFSRTSNFINPTDSFSSIDAILMNHAAICALESIQPLYNQGRPHAPPFGHL